MKQKNTELLRKLTIATTVAVCAVAFLVLATPDTAHAATAVTNGKIVYDSSEGTNSTSINDIHTINPDGTGDVNLNNTPAVNDTKPDWSPDGTKIAYQSDATGVNQIHTMNADGSNQTNVSNSVTEDAYPDWSPDGTKLAYTMFAGDNTEIYTMTSTGGSPTNLTNNAAVDVLPYWSPDGSRILFTSDRVGGLNKVYVMNADGSNVVQLTSGSSNDGASGWSPDGTKILFTSDRDLGINLYVMNADGSNVVQLTTTNATSSDALGTYSPDGARIAFITDPAASGDSTQLFIMNADGTNLTEITNVTSDKIFLSWQTVITVTPDPTSPVPDPVSRAGVLAAADPVFGTRPPALPTAGPGTAGYMLAAGAYGAWRTRRQWDIRRKRRPVS